MLEFVLSNVFMVAAGVVLYLVAHSLPRVGESEPKKQGFLERWVTSDVPEKVDAVFSNFLGKLLRRTKVFLLKIDNSITASLKKMKQENGAAKTLDFKEIMEDKEKSGAGEKRNLKGE